jgi:hypothetical protein
VAHRGGREHVENVVRAQQGDVNDGHDRVRPAGFDDDDVGACDGGAVDDAGAGAEEPPLCRCAGGHRPGHRVVPAEHRERLRVLDDAPLGPDVRLEAVVPVQVIGADVEHGRDLTARCLDGLELK